MFFNFILTFCILKCFQPPPTPRRGWAGSGEALCWRPDGFISQSPGCLQDTIPAPGLVAAWQLLPCSGTVFGFQVGHFVMKSRPQARLRVVRCIMRSDTTNSEATGSEPSKHGDLWRTERSGLLSHKRAFRERVTSASLAEGAWAVGPETALLPSWTPASPLNDH
jgi:hypothetical protein